MSPSSRPMLSARGEISDIRLRLRRSVVRLVSELSGEILDMRLQLR